MTTHHPHHAVVPRLPWHLQLRLMAQAVRLDLLPGAAR